MSDATTALSFNGAEEGETLPALLNGITPTRSPKYNQESINKAIATSRPKIGKKEARAIHRLLKGRH